MPYSTGFNYADQYHMPATLTAPPDALLLLTSQCPQCPTVLQGLSELVKKGIIGRLEAVNIMARPEIARQYGVRSVPWILIGEFELEGMHSPAELQQWARRASTETGLSDYYADLLKNGQLPKALNIVNRKPDHLSALFQLAADPDTELTVRIGVSAVIEHFAGDDKLLRELPALIELANNGDPRVRSDASHFLALTHSADAVKILEQLTRDTEAAVRHVAQDSLEELREHLSDAEHRPQSDQQ